VRALRGVDLILSTGEVIGLVGDNGAGKSTLVNILAGVLAPDGGTIEVDGTEKTFSNPNEARKAGIETVFQKLHLISTLDISENVFLNRELYYSGLFKYLEVMNKRAMRRNVQQQLDGLGLNLPAPTTKVGALSGGQRQAVAIARAIYWQSKILLLDEPSAALGVRQTEVVLSLIERLKAMDIGMIFISHNLPQVMRVADRIVVLRLGQKVFDAPPASCTVNDVVAHITGAALMPAGPGFGAAR
jgi:ABC-type sugar transport system ATPase subunit